MTGRTRFMPFSTAGRAPVPAEGGEHLPDLHISAPNARAPAECAREREWRLSRAGSDSGRVVGGGLARRGERSAVQIVEAFAAAWSGRAGDTFSSLMTTLPKYVVSARSATTT